MPSLIDTLRKPAFTRSLRQTGAAATAERATLGELPGARGPANAMTPATAGAARPGDSLPANLHAARPDGAGVRTATVERPRSRPVTTVPDSGLNLANPEKVNLHNALKLMAFCKEAKDGYTHAVGHTQFLYRDYGTHQVIAYSGSKEILDWAHDANIVKTRYKQMGWVHTGFATAYEEILPLQDTLIDRQKPLIVSGHSLGGATATLAALDLKQRGYNVHSVYTFGSPRVGYSDFKSIYGKAGLPTWRFVNAYDVVPRIPKVNYHHVGEPFYLATGGRLLDKQESAWNLWPWNVPRERISSHHLPNYMANLQKYIS